MVTYTDEELAEYLLENAICTTKELDEKSVSSFAFNNGFSWGCRYRKMDSFMIKKLHK